MLDRVRKKYFIYDLIGETQHIFYRNITRGYTQIVNTCAHLMLVNFILPIEL